MLRNENDEAVNVKVVTILNEVLSLNAQESEGDEMSWMDDGGPQ